MMQSTDSIVILLYIISSLTILFCIYSERRVISICIQLKMSGVDVQTVPPPDALQDKLFESGSYCIKNV